MSAGAAEGRRVDVPEPKSRLAGSEHDCAAGETLPFPWLIVWLIVWLIYVAGIAAVDSLELTLSPAPASTARTT